MVSGTNFLIKSVYMKTSSVLKTLFLILFSSITFVSIKAQDKLKERIQSSTRVLQDFSKMKETKELQTKNRKRRASTISCRKEK